ncbi:hypothetical protein TTHERM_01043160 (macronuclear) [Tetrahymena thermophila SB210]|uniref:Uncharacterized protein n=1 Tax=Tetrahymena thermophila (strain SB210) TaxID=312017 RepID=Q22CJ3_TETTS|nr:hypothetical protein TTHERM_01043160 [Tetrahymena thermophila SB210]EAR82999.1 hypothetical protein TTHERM_01043160 [Tetrahymena thermophila SB210]|eukprot:XP_001030662.1 hypothetical protein TTHERM_01043160 [Tetrahymena thermophila SB210]
MENQNFVNELNKSEQSQDMSQATIKETELIENSDSQIIGQKMEQEEVQNQEETTEETAVENDTEKQAKVDMQKDENIQLFKDMFEEKILLFALQTLVATYNNLDKSQTAKAIELLKEIILLKKKLKLNCLNEFNCILSYTMNLERKEFTKLGLEAFYEIKAQISPDDAEDNANLYSFICTAEMILGNSDTAQFVIEEALAYIKAKGLDKNGLQTSGLIRQRTKIYENRQQHKEYVEDHKLSISILENVDPHLKTDFHDKYIAQMIPQYIETEMEKLKIYDFENQEKRLKQAYDIWKKREGDNPKDFCNFKTTFLLLALYYKFKDPSEYLDLQQEIERNNNILKGIIFNSGQYLSIFTKSLFILSLIKKQQSEAQQKQNGNGSIESNQQDQQVVSDVMHNQENIQKDLNQSQEQQQDDQQNII